MLNTLKCMLDTLKCMQDTLKCIIYSMHYSIIFICNFIDPLNKLYILKSSYYYLHFSMFLFNY